MRYPRTCGCPLRRPSHLPSPSSVAKAHPAPGAPTAGPKTIRTGQKVLFVNRVQHHDDRPLKHLVFKSRDPNRAGLGGRVPLWDMHPPHRRRSVRAGLGPFQQRLQVPPQVHRIVRSRLSVHARGPVVPRSQVSLVQPTEIDVVSQGGESHVRRLLRQLSYPLLFR
jgi:hypothetical protein